MEPENLDSPPYNTRNKSQRRPSFTKKKDTKAQEEASTSAMEHGDSMELTTPRGESTSQHTPEEYPDDSQDYSYDAQEEHHPEEDLGCGADEEDDHLEVPAVPEEAEQHLEEPVEPREAAGPEPTPTTADRGQEDIIAFLRGLKDDLIQKMDANNQATNQSIQDMKSSLREDLRTITQSLRSDLRATTQQLKDKIMSSNQTLKAELQHITGTLKIEVEELKEHIETNGWTKMEPWYQQVQEKTQEDELKTQPPEPTATIPADDPVVTHNQKKEGTETTHCDTTNQTTEEMILELNQPQMTTTSSERTTEPHHAGIKYKVTTQRPRRQHTQLTIRMERYLEEDHKENNPTNTSNQYYQLRNQRWMKIFKNEVYDPKPSMNQQKQNMQWTRETGTSSTEDNMVPPRNGKENQHSQTARSVTIYHKTRSADEDNEPQTSRHAHGENYKLAGHQQPTPGPRGPDEGRHPQGGG